MTDENKHPIGAALLDLRTIAREHHCCTFIRLETPFYTEHQPKLWIVSNMVEFREQGRSKGEYTLYSRLVAGATDFEHDSGYAFSFPVVGLQFVSCYYGRPQFEAWIKPGLNVYGEDFNVPPEDYDPVADAEVCSDCAEPHPIVPYLSCHNAELYQKVAGCKVIIEMGLDPERVNV